MCFGYRGKMLVSQQKVKDEVYIKWGRLELQNVILKVW